MARNFPIPWTPMKMDASSIHLLRLLSRENSARVYLIFGHLALVFGFLVAAPETGALIVTAIFFLLGFRWLRRYFSLVSWDPGLAYPVGFFYLGHTLLLFSLLLIRSSDAFGWCFLTTLGGLLLLLAHHMKQQNLQQFQEMVKLRDDPGTVIPKAVTLPEILRDEYFMEKSSTAALNTRQYYQMVLTNLRLIIFHTRKLSFQEIPLSEVEKLELFTSRWYLSFKAMLFIALNIFLVFFILAAVPVLCLLAFPLSLVLIVWKLRLVNVLVVHTREGSLWFSGNDFNAYFMKERVEGAIRENFSYQLKVPAYLHSQDPGQEKKGPGILHRLLNRLPRDKISQAGSSLLKPLGKELSLEQIRENRLIGSFYAPDMAPPDQPRISFGLPNFFNARELKQEKRWMKRWFRLAYSLLVFSVFFYYEPIGGIFVLLGLMAVVLFLVAWNKEGKIQIRREELEALRDFGVASWEKARVLKGDERFVENPDKPASGPNPGSSYQDWWKDKPWLLRRSLYVLGWGIIFLSLLTAKAENNGAYYLSGLLPGTILLMVYKFLSLRAEDKGLARFHQHEHHLLESLLPWLPEEMRNEESGFFTGLAAPLRRLRDWVDEFLASMEQWLGDLGKKD